MGGTGDPVGPGYPPGWDPDLVGLPLLDWWLFLGIPMGGVEGIAVMVDDVAMPEYKDNRK